jgi:hypothetical protein
MSFDVHAQVYRFSRYNWQNFYELFCVCRGCSRLTIFLVSMTVEGHQANMNQLFYKPGGMVAYPDALNQYFKIESFVSLRDNTAQKPPEHLPEGINNAFNEGAACLTIGCNNAAATMFRLCVDLETRPLLPNPADATKAQPPNNRIRRDLGLRLGWMFDNNILPSALRELAKCIREDANDGAHVGNLTKEDTEDLLDFATALLERLITEPKRLELAEARRAARRKS